MTVFGIIATNLIGCETKLAEVRRLNESGVVLTGADVRMAYTHPAQYDEQARRVKAQHIFCAEPSPDVAKAVQNAFGLGAGARALHPSGVEGQLKTDLTSAQVQALAQLGERMATIQLLRDGLYRACEAYANGAFSEVTYAVLLSRYDDSMITLLFGELAAGNFGRSLVGLGGSAESISSPDPLTSAQLDERALKVGKAAADLQARKEDLRKAKEAGEAVRITEFEAIVKKTEEDLRKETNALRQGAGLRAGANTNMKVGNALDVRPSAEIVDLLGNLTRSYLYDVNTDALAVACIVALAGASKSDASLLSTWCSQGALTEILNVQNRVLEKKIDESSKRYQSRPPTAAPSIN
jgi:hypothetical protein